MQLIFFNKVVANEIRILHLDSIQKRIFQDSGKPEWNIEE